MRQQADGAVEIYTFVYLHEAALNSVEQAEATDTGSLYNCMSTILFCAFCLESYLNHIGNDALPYWDKALKRNINSRNKLKIISHHLGLQTDPSRRPFQSFQQIFKVRDLLAHGETEVITNKLAIVENRLERPLLYWEEMCTVDKARRFLQDTEDMIGEIHRAAGYDDGPLDLALHGIASPRKES